MTTESSKNGAMTTLSRINLSGYVGNLPTFSWMLNSRVGLDLELVFKMGL